MSVQIIQDRFASYECKTPLDEENVIKEITQEIALMALSRKGFFNIAEFHEGTALRILYGLQRFSEDLDFALLKPDETFKLQNFLTSIADEFVDYGYDVEIQDRTKAQQTIQKAFLKDDSIGKVLLLQYPQPERSRKKIRIKLEVDTNPPLGATTEIKYLDFPLPFSIQTKDLASSFAGKLHALLCRSYLKGRDWYDFIWYVAKRAPVNYLLLSKAIEQNGPWQGQDIAIDKAWLIKKLAQKIKSVTWNDASDDVARFLKPREQESLALWSEDFFMSSLAKLEDNLS